MAQVGCRPSNRITHRTAESRGSTGVDGNVLANAYAPSALFFSSAASSQWKIAGPCSGLFLRLLEIIVSPEIISAFAVTT